MKFRLPKKLLCLLALGLAGNLDAAIWTGGADASWANVANWNGTIPDNGGTQDVVYDATSTANLTQSLNGSYSLIGLTVGSPSGNVTLANGTGTNTLSIGSGGITLNGSRDLTLNNGFTLQATGDQSWSVASGRTLTINQGIADSGVVNIAFNGAGTYFFTTATTNNFNGGGTVTFGSGATFQMGLSNSQGTGTWFGSNGSAGTGSTITFNGNNTIRSNGGTGRFINNNIIVKGDLVLGHGGGAGVNLYGTVNLDGGVRVFNTATNAGVASVINGVISNGGLTKSGSGTLNLRGNNTYTGVTTIKGAPGTIGTLNVLTIKNGGVAGNLGAAGSAAANIVFGESGSSTGQLIYAGAGETTDRLFTLNGNAIIDNNGSGALHFTNSGNLGKTSGIAQTLTLGGSYAAASNTLASVINNGSGGAVEVIKKDAGSWLLSGANTYSGVTTISAGSLVLGNATALGTTAAGTSVTAGAVLDLNGQTIGAEALTLNGTGISSAGALVNNALTAASYAGNITLGSASSIGGSGDMTISGNISGAVALSKVGTGTVTINGSNAASSVNVNSGTLVAGSGSSLGNGTITVTGGTLDLNGQSLGNSIVLSGGSLIGASAYTGALGGSGGNFVAGTDAGKVYNISAAGITFGSLTGQGTFSGGLVTVRGAYTPGNSPGTQTFTSGLSLTGATTLEIAANGSASDLINVTGGLTLGGGATLSLSLFGTADYTSAFWDSNQSFTLINADSVTGSFASIDLVGLNADALEGSWSTAWDGNAFKATWTATAIPEPSSLGLFGLGMAGMLLRRRRKQA